MFGNERRGRVGLRRLRFRVLPETPNPRKHDKIPGSRGPESWGRGICPSLPALASGRARPSQRRDASRPPPVVGFPFCSFFLGVGGGGGVVV